MEKQNEMEIDLIDLLFFLKKKIWVIVAAFMVFGLLGAGFTAFFAEDEYTAETQMYVLNRNESGINQSDFSVSNYMIEDYKVLITGKNVYKEVIETLNLDMTTAELAKKISVEAIKESRVLQIKVVDNDPQRAAEIANCVREISSEKMKDIMDLEAVNLVYKAEVPAGKSGPNVTRNTVIAAAIGLALALVVLVVIYLLDDTIRSEDDVERRMGLSVLGVIPMSAELEAMANNNAAAAAAEKKTGSVLARRKK